MIAKWKKLPYVTRFSIVAFIVAMFLGFLSLGMTGALIYESVKFLISPSLDDLHGDLAWPSWILASLLWPFGFLFSGFFWQRLANGYIKKYVLRLFYVGFLWVWGLLVWMFVLKSGLIS